MGKTVNKQKVWISLLCLLLMLCVLVSCNDSYTLLNAVTTEQLIPCPDEIAYGTYTLLGEACQALYQQLIEQFDLNENKFELVPFSSEAQRKLTVGDGEISFRFTAPQKFCRDVETAQLTLSDDFEFDEIKMLFHSTNGLFFEYYRNGERCLLQGANAALHFSDLIAQGQFYDIFDPLMAEAIVGLVPPSVSGGEPLVSHAFPAIPDAIVLYVDGRSVSLEGIEKAVVFEIISPMIAADLRNTFVTQGSSAVPALETVKGRAFVELRYHRPQTYAAEDAPEGAGTRTYESLLLAFGVCGDVNTHMCDSEDYHVIYMRDGQYDWMGSYNRHITSTPEFMTLYAYMYMRVCFEA